MKNFKFILGFAIFGFLLSFIVGLASRSGAGRVFLNAFVFAAVFFCLALGIQFLFSKLFSAEQDSFSPEHPVRMQGAANSGHAVDIVIQDEDLPSEENAPGFFVGASHNMLNPNDMNASAEAGGSAAVQAAAPEPVPPPKAAAESERGAAEEPAAAQAAPSEPQGNFVPVRLAESASNISGTEAKSAGQIESEAQAAPSVPPPDAGGEGDEELDMLPDLESIEGIAAVQEPEAEASDSGEIPSSDDGRTARNSAGISDVADGKDAALMAKAISTLLAGEH